MCLSLLSLPGAVDSVLHLGCYICKQNRNGEGRGGEERGAVIQVFPRFVPEGITKFDWKKVVTAYGITLKELISL